MRYLILRLEAPMMAFGGETIDNYGVIRWFPSASMLTGLLANALGWRRTEREAHQRLQDRLVFAARIDREPAGMARLKDFQTAQLGAEDKGWTTRGEPEGRAGGPNTYKSPHLRYRDYFADMCVSVALRLEPDDEQPTLDELEAALEEPARPLFIGRKPCLPSEPLFAGFKETNSALEALRTVPLADGRNTAAQVRLLWPHGEERLDGVYQDNQYMLTDERNWVSGLHGGGRLVYEGTLEAKQFAAAEDGEKKKEEQP